MCVCMSEFSYVCVSVGRMCVCAKLEIQRKRNENKTRQGKEKMCVKNSNGITREIIRRQERNSIRFSSAC